MNDIITSIEEEGVNDQQRQNENVERKFEKIDGCPIMSDDDWKNQKNTCARYWKNVGLDPHEYGGLFGINSCKGKEYYINEGYTWTAQNCQKPISNFNLKICSEKRYIRDIMVRPGCSLYLFGQPDLKLYNYGINAVNFVNIFTGPTTIYSFQWSTPGITKAVQSMACSCNYKCTPKDKWVLIMECDNRNGAAEATCEYTKTVGTTFGTEKSKGGSQSNTNTQTSSFHAEVEVGAAGWGFSAAVKTSFGMELGTSSTTNVDWNSISTDTFDESVTMTVKETVPPGHLAKVEQAVGSCGDATVRTNVFKITKTP